MKVAKREPILFVFGFYAVCCVFRGLEYFLLRTDQTIIGEAFVHKLVGIALLAAALYAAKYKGRDIGLLPCRFVRDTGKGLLLGGGAFLLAYATEMIIQTANGNAPALSVYVTSYAIGGNRGMQGGAVFLLICILGNIVNVAMEEGVFRGLFCKLIGEKHSFWIACIVSSLLFGIWHIAQPIRNVFDGEQSAMGALMSGILLVVTSALLGIQYCMLNRVTGSIWAGMAAHFINNTTVNLLHVTTAGGADELQAVRITIAQTVSFLVVLCVYIADRRKRLLDEVKQ